MMKTTIIWTGVCVGALAFTACDSGDGDDFPVVPDMLDPGPCEGEEGIVSIERPIFPDQRNSPRFRYAFKHYEGTDPTAPTVIFLPGGPGSASIADERDFTIAPPTHAVIQTDPRGLGCNAPADLDAFPDEFYRTTYLADDVLGIVEHLQLDNYVIYGVSYGTVLATMTVSMAEAEDMAPRAAVLEGVIGRAFTDEEVDGQYHIEWRAIRDRLPAAVRDQLMSEPLPLDLSAEEWGAGIVPLLSIGKLQEGPPLLESLLMLLGEDGDEAGRQALRDTLLGVASSSIDAFGQRLHDIISCREITESNFRDMKLVDGELQPTELYCDTQAVDEPFAASDWPITVPIYYFNGRNDPNTPLWQAEIHFDVQTEAPRHLVTADGAGHNPFILNFGDCKTAIWDAIGTGSGFASALDTCAWPTELDSAAQ